MFRKLKIELVLTNLILTSLVLVTIFSGIYILMRGSLDHSAYMRMMKTAEIENIPPSEPPGKNPNPSDNFIVKIDQSNKIYEISTNSRLSKNQAETAVQNVLKSNKKRGNISYDNFTFRYIKEPKSYGSIIVLQDKSFDNRVLNSLIGISAIICLVSLILVFIISLFLANLSLKPIIKAWEKQKAFVADASHELRTPLSVITTNLDLVLDNGEETIESQGKWLGNIKLETKRMTKLIEDLLFIARSDAHKTSLLSSKFDLSSSIMKSIIPFEAIAVQHGIELKSDVLPDVNFLGNEGRINQLIVILIDNAIKHTPEGGIIEVKMAIIKNKIQISVSDTGEGIEEEYLDKIFERFYKVDKSRAKKDGHFGLGLSIAKTIVEEHKGNISVSSILGKGSVFKVIFPLN
ncbi:signal transduction histidine kinase [Clostridium algifaecis]|uniref:histidine kinase n=1 Tax=Clostridium algifaecis TaxID=1472040 RepID=A0ABS4KV16_9CLOT|nr:ATP-binding protein [Clostridium algifaecis]MBP2033862.1 signal transduction histidine kinase [Clostridium algifaecis]